MMQELKSGEFEKVRSLYREFDYSLSVLAAIEGNNPGRIFVDDVINPQTSLALTVEGYLLVGDSDNPGTNKKLGNFIKDKIFSGEIYVNGDWSMSLAVHPEDWEARLPELIPTHELERIERYHYLCREVKYNWREGLPEGYTVRRVDRALLNDKRIIFPDPLGEWMDFEGTWWTKDNFLARGISFGVIKEGKILAWCTPDCTADDRIDVGVITHPSHRRKGLAAAVVAAAVEECFNQGFNAIGWHCNADNIGSRKTAEKVGFKQNRKYRYYYFMYDPIDHLAELGWYYYKLGDYKKTVHYYDQVFTLRDENADYYYHLASSAWALLEQEEKALKYLKKAADQGWKQAGWTKNQEEFAFLNGLPEWDAVINQMENMAKED